VVSAQHVADMLAAVLRTADDAHTVVVSVHGMKELLASRTELLDALQIANTETKLYPEHPGRWAEVIARATRSAA
jgi:hypothetical protein